MTDGLTWRRSQRLATSVRDLCAHHFPEQRDFYRPRRKSLRAGLCSRRAGKTRGGNESDVSLARQTKDGRYLYINETRAEAKRLAWHGARGDGMMSLVRDLGMIDSGEAKINETELSIHFPRINSWIFLVGVDDEAAIRKALGTPWNRVRWDEAQRIPRKFNQTILETLLPALLDYGGEFLMTGTAERDMDGLFCDVTREDRDERWNRWQVHRWTLMQNPFWGRAKDGYVVWGVNDEVVSGPHSDAEMPAAVLAARHLTGVLGLQELLGGPEIAPLDAPVMQRQAFGRWVKEDSNFVYAVNRVTDEQLLYAEHRGRPDGFVDVVAALADLPWDWRDGQFAMGVDLGFNDPFAVSVGAWHPSDPVLYELVSWKRSYLDSDAQMDAIKAIREHVNVGMIAADAGGIGKQVVSGWSKEFVSRYGLPIVEAQKQHKQTAIQTMNSDILHGRIKLRRNSPLLDEMRRLQWSSMTSGSGRMIEDPELKNDLCDSWLYMHKSSYHFRGRPEEDKPVVGTAAHYAREASELEDEAEDMAGENWRQYA